MSFRHPLGGKWTGKVTGEADGTGAKKRSAGAFDDAAVGASRDAKRRQRPGPKSIWPPFALPKHGRPKSRPAGGFQAARRQPPSSTSVSDSSASRSQPQSRPPKGTALGASAPGASATPRAASGGFQAASAGPRGPKGAPSNSPRKHQTLSNGLLPSAKNFSNTSSAPVHVDRLPLTADGLPTRKPRNPVELDLKPADRSSRVLYDESSSSDDDEYSDSLDDLSDSSESEPDESSEDDSSEDDSSEDDHDGDGVDPPRGSSAEKTGQAAQISFEEIPNTPSGKPYNMLKNEHGVLEQVNGALFPDGYQLQHLASFPEYRFICPVRDCRKLFVECVSLVCHFSAAHPRCHFIDNLDKEGTLTIQRKVGSGRSVVVSQSPLDSNAPPLKSPSLPILQKRPDQRKPSKIDRVEAIQDINDAEYNPARLTEPRNRAPPNRHKSERSTMTGPSVSGPVDARAARSFGNTPLEPFAVDAADIESEVWTYIKPFVGKRWLASFQSEHERSAFLEAMTLPKRNEMDKAWLEGNQKSHQKSFRALISIVIYVVGVRATCNGCEKRSMVRKRNCMVLPPEAKDMRELQKAVRSQCVNCFFFPTAHPCEFTTAGISSIGTSNGVKQTPIQVPTPPPTLATMLASRPSLSRPALSQPISKSPVPVPVLPLRPQAAQTKDSQAQFPAEESDGGAIRRLRLRSAGEPDAEIDSHGDSIGDGGGLNSNHAYSDDVISNDEPASASATTTASSSMSGAPPVASAVVSRAFTLFGEITQLPAHQQSEVYEKMAAMLEVASGARTTTRAAAPGQNQGNISHPSYISVADGWEIAPGRLISGGEPVAFSTSSLRRKTVGMNSAQYITPTEKVLNKHIAALDHVRIKPEADWECKFSVTKGLVKVKMGVNVDAKIGYGGIWLVKHECILTNVLHDESHIQVWWKHVDE